MQALSDWLASIGMARVERVLLDNDIDAEVITSLTETDLEKLGVSMGDRKRLLQAIGVLRQQAVRAPLIPGLASQGELRQLTIMFCDLVDSTQLCERLSPSGRSRCTTSRVAMLAATVKVTMTVAPSAAGRL